MLLSDTDAVKPYPLSHNPNPQSNSAMKFLKSFIYTVFILTFALGALFFSWKLPTILQEDHALKSVSVKPKPVVGQLMPDEPRDVVKVKVKQVPSFLTTQDATQTTDLTLLQPWVELTLRAEAGQVVAENSALKLSFRRPNLVFEPTEGGTHQVQVRSGETRSYHGKLRFDQL